MLTGINILVVEDSALNQKIVNFMLNKQKAKVTSAMNGKEALDILKRNDFDIVLMDLQMPGMDGFTAARHIRDDLKNDVPIIALTADLFAKENNEYLEAGMNACIAKPFEINELTNLILRLTAEKTTNSLNKTV